MFSSKQGIAITAGLALGAAASSYLFYRYGKVSSSTQKAKNTQDCSSLSNLDEFTTRNVHLDLSLDFEAKKVLGNAIYDLESLTNDLREIDLDVKALKIFEVFVDGEKVNFKVRVVPKKEELGQQLNIELPKGYKASQKFTLSVRFETLNTAEATTWNWLTPQQTLDKRLPFLFTQCQPTFCRSIFPCQDSPSVKFKYSAKVKAPKDFKVFMSAKQVRVIEDTSGGSNTFEFSLDIPIPSYLIALVAGDLSYRKVSERTGVIAEPSKIDECYNELTAMEDYLKTLENFTFPYVWGEYNIIILPPSFPYGGMENPLLTFASPSIIVGDKSNISTVIHEMAHSWSGNLVSCKNWTNFWLNEGITVYLERQVVRELKGEEEYKLSSLEGNERLREAVEAFGADHSFTTLTPDISNCHPDDAFSIIPYEKGFQFLTYLEQKVGRDNFKEFLRKFFKQFINQSIETKQFKDLFKAFFIDLLGKEEGQRVYDSVPWDEWLLKPGMPIIKLEFDSAKLRLVNELVEEFIACDETNIPSKFESLRELGREQKVIFLKQLTAQSDKISLPKVNFLDLKSGFSDEVNPEIVEPWLVLAIKKQMTDIYPYAAEFLGKYGRIKFIKPIYVQLAKVDREFAIKIFEHNRDFYHSIAVAVLKKILGL